jgi:2,3-bisphosphoglycerate-dependent phosphoglycerate mutase
MLASKKAVYKVVFARHGESVWNKSNQFTGWTDVTLTDKGHEEAKAAGDLLKEKGFEFDIAHTSVLKRAILTLNNVLDRTDHHHIPIHKSWRLNERHYGALQGLNKAETAAKHGDEQVLIWRRSFDIPPPELTEDDTRHPSFEKKYALLPKAVLPGTEVRYFYV